MKLVHATSCPDCEEIFDRTGRNLASLSCPACGSTAPSFPIARVIAPLAALEAVRQAEREVPGAVAG